MSINKKVLSLFLAVILTLTMIPIAAFAQENNAVNGEPNLGSENQTATPGGTPTGNGANVALIYNLEKREVAVTDFNEDGSYTIQLEKNAFFPYEVQFKYDGQTTVKTFDTIDSTVTVDNHVISVASDYDDDVITQIGMYVGGKYIAATPEKKTFTNSQVAPRSLLPLTRQNLTLDLRDLTPEQTKSVQVSARTPIDTAVSSKTVMWNYNPNGTTNKDTDSVDSYSALPTGAVDMSRVSGFTMLVGDSGNQLDASRTRYMVTVQRNSTPSINWLDLYEENAAVRKDLNVSQGQRTQGDVTNYTLWIPSTYPANAEYYLNLSLSYNTSYTEKVYTGLHDTAQLAATNGTDITTVITGWGLGSGHKANYSTAQGFTVVWTLSDGTFVHLQKFTVKAEVDSDATYYPSSNYLFEEGRSGSYRINASRSSSWSEDPLLPDVDIVYFTLESGNIPDRNYYTYFSVYDSALGDNNNSLVTKAVRGHYNSLDAAASQPDIKDQLIKTYDEFNAAAGVGYVTNYRVPVDFTIFIGTEVYKYRYIAMEYQGSDDVYFDVTGATEITQANVYKIHSRHDSVSSQFNSQILLIDEAVDLSNIRPTFTTATGLVAYVGETSQQVSGANAHDFDNKSVNYTVRSESGNFRRNYSVSFVKAVTGDAKLYATVDGQQSNGRRVLFDPGTDNRHDIFIANIGNQQLTGLSVRIDNAVNVKLDDYWIVGDAGNNTLDAFNAASVNSDGELSNTAKIRLLPVGLGAISGTLVISSDNGGVITFALTGEATEPKITTLQSAFDNAPAIKYVPYAFMIQSNNDYSWNRETFRLQSGTLPSGMVIRPSGELYGVPKETGTFTFTVRVQYSDSRFAASTATFTLTVLDNTNENVASAWDYNITDFVAGSHGGTMTSYSSWTFRTEGSYDDFVGFWLDGKKLTEGVDYDSEPGSTVITVRAQTFQNAGPGQHTISAEFRQNKDENRELTRSPQNYNANPGGNPNPTKPSSSGSSSSSSSWTNRNNTTPPPPPVNPVAVAQTEAKSADKGLPKLTVKLRGVDIVSLKDLKEIAAIAKKENKTPWLNVDSMSEDGRSVDVRVSINPALAKNSMNLAGSTYSPRAQITKKLFEKFFRNELIAVISLTQKGGFGQPAEICVRVPDGTNVEELVFYSYDPETNSYRQIKDPNAWIDQKGYLHFTTAYANEIIVSNGKLEQK